MLDQVVLVNSARRDALWCTGMSRHSGFGGTTAEFILPAYLFDTYRSDLRDQLVVVYVGNTLGGGFGSEPDFAGFLDVDSAVLTSSADNVTLSGHSMTGYLSHVFVGQETRQSVKRFYLIDPETGKKTGYTPERILAELFRAMPEPYKDFIALGDTRVINTTEQNLQPELVFRHQSYQQVVEAVLDLFGDVTFDERFNSAGRCYLDFYRIGEGRGGRVMVTVGSWGDWVTQGVNVTSLNHSQSTENAVTRVIAVGNARRFVVSAWTGDDVEAKRVRPAWDPDLELAVLVDPKNGKPGAAGYVQGSEHCFRRLALPAVFKKAVKCKALGPKKADGSEYEPQVWKFGTFLVQDEETGELEGVVDYENRILIKNREVDLEKGIVTLGNTEDGLNLVHVGQDEEGNELREWAPAEIGITFAIESDFYVTGDTGVAYGGVRLPFASAGLTELVPRDDLNAIQATNEGFLSALGGHLFECHYFDEETGEWVSHTTKHSIVDDSKTLKAMAAQILKERPRRHQSLEVGLVCFSRGYKPGLELGVNGIALSNADRFVITGVEHDFMENTTQVTADNVKPPHRHGGVTLRDGDKDGFVNDGDLVGDEPDEKDEFGEEATAAADEKNAPAAGSTEYSKADYGSMVTKGWKGYKK